MADEKPASGNRMSSHILPTAGTMLGICTTLIGLVKVHESHAGKHSVDEHAGLLAIMFLLSALASYISIRIAHRPKISAALERLADTCFVIGLIALAIVSFIFAWELI
jgi:hypothetical protein